MCNDCNVYYQQFAESQQNDSMQLETAAMVLLGRIPCFSRRDSAVVYTRSMQTLVPRGAVCALLHFLVAPPKTSIRNGNGICMLRSILFSK